MINNSRGMCSFTGRLHRGGLMVHPITHMTKQTPNSLHKANTSALLPTQVNLLHYQIWKNDHRPLRLLLNVIFRCFSKISGVCITLLISLHINISRFRLKNAFILEGGKKASDVRRCKPCQPVDLLYVAL